MKKFVFLMITIFVIALLAIPSHAKKQINWQNVSSRQLDCKLIDSLNYVIVGDDGKIISSSDGGETWKWLECGLRNIFYAVDFINLERGAVVGDSGAFALTTDAGKTWKTGAIDTTTFYSVKMLDENTIFASGKNTCIYKTNDFGDTWKKVFNGDEYTQNNWLFLNHYRVNMDNHLANGNMCFSDATTGYAAGVGPFVLKTTDAGDSWFKVLEKGDSAIFCSVDFIDNNTGIVVGGNYNFYYQYDPIVQDTVVFYNNEPYILLTQDGGETWENLKSPIDQIIYLAVKIYDESHFLISGESTILAETKDSGKNWDTSQYVDFKYLKDTYNVQTSEIVKGDKYSPHSFSFDNNGNILAIDKEIIIRSGDFGYSFYTLKKFGTYDPINKTFKLIFKPIYSADNKILIPSHNSTVFGSYDNGVSWDRMFPHLVINSKEESDFWAMAIYGDGNLWTGHFKDNINGFIAGKKQIGGKNSIYTNDGGYTWFNTDTIRTNTTVSFISPDTGFVINDNKFYNTTLNYQIKQTNDAGKNWDSINVINLPSDPNEKVWFRVEQLLFPDSVTGFLTLFNGWVNTDDTVHYPSGKKSIFNILKTTDFCRTFDTISTLEYDRLDAYNINFFNKDIAFLTKSGNIVLKTNDGFQTYEEILLPGTYHFINEIFFFDEDNGIAVGRQDTIFLTEDAGKSWTIEVLQFNRRYFVHNNYTYEFNSISKAKTGDIFLTGKGRIVRGIIVDSTVGVDEEPKIEIYQVFDISIRPNPVTNIAKINLYGLHYTAGKELFLRIYDINGHLVKDISSLANLNKNQNTAELEVELSDIPSGIYFIELESNNMIRVQKFIKE